MDSTIASPSTPKWNVDRPFLTGRFYQTKLEGVSANRARQFAVVLEFNKKLCAMINHIIWRPKRSMLLKSNDEVEAENLEERIKSSILRL